MRGANRNSPASPRRIACFGAAPPHVGMVPREGSASGLPLPATGGRGRRRELRPGMDYVCNCTRDFACVRAWPTLCPGSAACRCVGEPHLAVHEVDRPALGPERAADTPPALEVGLDAVPRTGDPAGACMAVLQEDAPMRAPAIRVERADSIASRSIPSRFISMRSRASLGLRVGPRHRRRTPHPGLPGLRLLARSLGQYARALHRRRPARRQRAAGPADAPGRSGHPVGSLRLRRQPGPDVLRSAEACEAGARSSSPPWS